MTEASRYCEGQRWGFKSPIAEFESTFVIGNVIEAHPEWGWNERKYEVYIRFSEAAQPFIPSDYDGTILSLTDKGLDRSATELLESGVKLPWWWVYGRRFRSTADAPNSRSALSCDRVGDSLSHIFESAMQVAEGTRKLEDALRKHREKFGSKKKPMPSSTVAESWERIKAWYAENAHPITNSLAAGASAFAVTQVEKEIGASLPDDFRESVRLHDGGGWWVPWRHGELLSLERILEQWKMYSDWQAKSDYATGDSWRADDIKGPIKPLFWNKRRIYVTDNSGDHLTLDLDPPPEGTYGQVIDHSHETGPQEVVASGWGEFLRMTVDDLETGKYVYLEHEGSLELVEYLEKRR